MTTPFGGYKLSGFGGHDKSLHAHDQYTETKTDLDPAPAARVGSRRRRAGPSLCTKSAPEVTYLAYSNGCIPRAHLSVGAGRPPPVGRGSASADSALYASMRIPTEGDSRRRIRA